MRPESDAPTAATKTSDLPVRIAQISHQRGSFRDVTESDLEVEIAAARRRKATGDGESGLKDDGNGDGDGDGGGEGDSAEDRLKTVYNRRSEMLLALQQAETESMLALDFVSLILTKYASSTAVRQPESSVSPFLQNIVPTGSIAVDYTALPTDAQAARKKAEDGATVAQGWKSVSFANAAACLRSAATRLEKETSAENTYWEEVLRVKQHGWKVMHYPYDRRLLAVQCADLEAKKSYQDRGWVRLRRSAEGAIVLDQGNDTAEPRSLRVRIQTSEGTTLATSRAARLDCSSPQKERQTELWLQMRRDALFQEELWHEMDKEARSLLPHGVEVHKDHVQFLLTAARADSGARRVVLDRVSSDHPGGDGDDTVPREDEHNHEREDDLSAADAQVADGIALALQLLFSMAQRQAHERRRSELPQPLVPKRQPDPAYHLLRPIITHLRHRDECQAMTTALSALAAVMGKAGMRCSFRGPVKSPSPTVDDSSSPTTPAAIASAFLGAATSEMTFRWFGHVLIRIRVQTSYELSGIAAGTSPAGVRFEICSRVLSPAATRITSLRSLHTCRAAAMDEIEYLIQCRLVDEASSITRPGQPEEADHTPQTTDRLYGTDDENDEDDEDGSEFEYQPSESSETSSSSDGPALSLVPLVQEAGLMALAHSCGDQRGQLTVHLDINRSRLVLEGRVDAPSLIVPGSHASNALRTPEQDTRHVWSACGSEVAAQLSFADAVKAFVARDR
ncbi:RNA polymerase II mediator complex subunit [Ascosphaera acerosa]|nr:RNA polymerase II mediator complex subunit [Ascosphaera acerosa]